MGLFELVLGGIRNLTSLINLRDLERLRGNRLLCTESESASSYTL